MNPQDKAKELVEKFIQHMPLEDAEHGVTETMFLQYEKAKQCALIAVDEIIEWERINFGTNTKATDYWQQVKQEIEKL